MVAKTIRKNTTNETVKEQLLNSLREYDALEKPGLNIDNVTDPGEASTIINSYDEIIKTQNEKNRDEKRDAEGVQRYWQFY